MTLNLILRIILKSFSQTLGKAMFHAIVDIISPADKCKIWAEPTFAVLSFFFYWY